MDESGIALWVKKSKKQIKTFSIFFSETFYDYFMKYLGWAQDKTLFPGGLQVIMQKK